MSKSKGSRWERDFVAQCDERGLPARRVPLSGAMQHYPGDVEVCDEVLVECKYRADGSGFTRLYKLIEGRDSVRVKAKGITLWVRTMDAWATMMRGRMDGVEPPDIEAEALSSSGFSSLQGWIQGCQYIAVRMPRRGWLVVEVLER